MAVSRLRHWLPVMLCMGLIFYASSLPAYDIPLFFPFQGVIFHLIAYLALGFCFSRALRETYSGIALFKIILFTFLFGAFFGISDELHQAFVPYRNVSGFDLFIDTLGAFLGGLIHPLVKR